LFSSFLLSSSARAFSIISDNSGIMMVPIMRLYWISILLALKRVLSLKPAFFNLFFVFPSPWIRIIIMVSAASRRRLVSCLIERGLEYVFVVLREFVVFG